MENRVRHDNYPGDHPEPHLDLDQRSPLIHSLRKGSKLFRIYKPSNDPLFFGRTGANRFDSPDQGFGVLYLGMDEHCSFIETFGQFTGIAAVTEAELERRHLAEVAILRPLRLIDLATSGGLARLGADARLLSGAHAVAQRWADALRSHPSKPHGILYPSRHDPARNACAVFDRPADSFRVTSRGSLVEPRNRDLLGRILDSYHFALIPQ